MSAYIKFEGYSATGDISESAYLRWQVNQTF